MGAGLGKAFDFQNRSFRMLERGGCSIWANGANIYLSCVFPKLEHRQTHSLMWYLLIPYSVDQTPWKAVSHMDLDSCYGYDLGLNGLLLWHSYITNYISIKITHVSSIYTSVLKNHVIISLIVCCANCFYVLNLAAQ